MKEQEHHLNKQDNNKDALTEEIKNLLEDLYTRITSKQSREAANKLFSSTSNDLRESYKETKEEI